MSGALPVGVPVASMVAVVEVPAPGPTPQVREGLEDWEVSPGIVGFLVTFGLVLACLPLFISMTRRLRRVSHDEQRAAAQDVPGSDGDAPVRPADGSGRPADGSSRPADGTSRPADGPGRSSDAPDRPSDGPAPQP